MFQLDWANKEKWEEEEKIALKEQSMLDKGRVKNTFLLYWREHCLECAPPDCYNNCQLYVSRKDKKCANFLYGIYPNPDFSGLFNFGADIFFRRWSKLETKIYGQAVSLTEHLAFQGFDRKITDLVNFLSDLIEPISPRRKLNRVLVFFRDAFLNRAKIINKEKKLMPDEFTLEVFSPENDIYNLILEYSDKEIKLRHAFSIKPGPNFYSIPVERFNFSSYPIKGAISLYPEDNKEVRIIFTWLDFVKYKQSEKDRKEALKPAKKVKCVAWDLDNTLWEGILIEDGIDNLMPKKESVDLIKKLDEKGIVQTIASKNNYYQVWEMIKRIELQDFFLYPAIHWGPKSASIKQIAKELNINIDTFALIDDSSFERSEVKSYLPQVRVYSDKQIPQLLSFDEFDVPITETSKNRRKMYLAEAKRKRIKDSYGRDYESFLRSCQMEMRIFKPAEEAHILRCLELVQRSNQLNLSTKRYSAEEFDKLLSNEGILSVAFECKDKFGDYGIVGFASVDEAKQNPTVQDFVLSCRVAQKMVEHTFFEWLANRQKQKGKQVLLADLIRTDKNTPLFKVFKDMPFKTVKQGGENILLKLVLAESIETKNIIKLKVNL